MTPPGSDDARQGSDLPPEPPYSEELLADLHAERLDPATAAHIRGRITDDPDALAVLEALDRTDADLRRHAADTDLPIPESVAARLQETLSQISREAGASAASAHGVGADHPPTPGVAAPLAPHPHRPQTSAAQRGRTAAGVGRGLSLGVRHILGASIGALALVAVIALAAGAFGSGGEVGDQRAADAASATSTPAAAPTSAKTESTTTGSATTGSNAPAANSTVTDSAATDATTTEATVAAATMLSVLGESSGAPFSSVDALRRCTAANGVSAQTVVVGSGEILVDETPRAVILLATGVAGRFDALVVELHCDTGDPATVSRTTIGAGGR